MARTMVTDITGMRKQCGRKEKVGSQGKLGITGSEVKKKKTDPG